MQIHELNKRHQLTQEGLGNLAGPGGLVDKLKTSYKTLKQNPGSGEQLRQATADTTFNAAQSNWADLYNRTASDAATQRWIAGLNKIWKTQAGVNMSLARAGEQLDEYGNAPNNSVDPRRAGGVANSIGNLKAQRISRNAKPEPEPKKQTQPQQQAQAQVSPEPMSDFKNKFLTWSDQRLASNTATMDEVRKDPQVKYALDKALAALETAQSNPAQWDQAFNNYMNIATTGIRSLTVAKKKQPSTAGDTTQPGNTGGASVQHSGVRRLLQTLGVQNPGMENIEKLKYYLENEGINSNVPSTGSASLDGLLQLIGKQ